MWSNDDHYTAVTFSSSTQLSEKVTTLAAMWSTVCSTWRVQCDVLSYIYSAQYNVLCILRREIKCSGTIIVSLKKF